MVLESIRHFLRGDINQYCGFIKRNRWVKRTSDGGYSCLESGCEYNGEEDGLPLNEVAIYVDGEFIRRNTWICNDPSGVPSENGVTVKKIER